MEQILVMQSIFLKIIGLPSNICTREGQGSLTGQSQMDRDKHTHCFYTHRSDWPAAIDSRNPQPNEAPVNPGKDDAESRVTGEPEKRELLNPIIQ